MAAQRKTFRGDDDDENFCHIIKFSEHENFAEVLNFIFISAATSQRAAEDSLKI